MVFRSGVPIWKYQVVQTELDRLVFHYMLRDGESLSCEMQHTLVGVLRRYLGDELQVLFMEGEFETTRSGKHRFVINRVLERTEVRG
jgi:hypothetical protein